jgi:hypothetical protein
VAGYVHLLALLTLKSSVPPDLTRRNTGACRLELLCRVSFPAPKAANSSRLDAIVFLGLRPQAFRARLILIRNVPAFPASHNHSHAKDINAEDAAAAAGRCRAACRQRQRSVEMLQHMGGGRHKSGAMLCAGNKRHKRNDVVLQQGRLLSLQRPVPEIRVQRHHDPARMHRQELGRLQKVLPGQR